MAPHKVHGTHVFIIIKLFKIAFKKRETMKQEQNFRLSKHSEIFGIVKNDKKFIIVVGEYKAVKKEFNTAEQADSYIGTKPYELIFNTIQIMHDYANQKNKKTRKKVSEDTKNN